MTWQTLNITQYTILKVSFVLVFLRKFNARLVMSLNSHKNWFKLDSDLTQREEGEYLFVDKVCFFVYWLTFGPWIVNIFLNRK